MNHVIKTWNALKNHDYIPRFTASIKILPDGYMDGGG